MLTSNVGCLAKAFDAAGDHGRRAVEHVGLDAEIGEGFLAGLDHVGEIGDLALHSARRDRIARADAGREKTHRAVVHARWC